MGNVVKKVPIVGRFMNFRDKADYYTMNSGLILSQFLRSENLLYPCSSYQYDLSNTRIQANILSTIGKLSQEGSLYDGDYIEEWIYKLLKQKGVVTFGDLKDGIKDNSNPNGYRLRVTAADITRGKILVLPDDISFYGINPDRLEVANAIRMSVSVPFVFKPVNIISNNTKPQKVYSIVDGGILDNFPSWLIDTPSSIYPELNIDINTSCARTIGVKIYDMNNNTSLFFSSISILKYLIDMVHNFGIPKHSKLNNEYLLSLKVSEINAFDFSLNEKSINYLLQLGINSSTKFFNTLI